MPRTILFAAAVLLWAGAAWGQAGHAASPEPFAHLTDAELAAKVGGGALVLSTLSDHEGYYVLVAGRSGPGEAELHVHWTDYMVIQQGEAQFIYGGILSGHHETIRGEWRGGAISGGTTITIKPGDFLMVPAGQPHLTIVQPGSMFRAIVFKARQ